MPHRRRFPSAAFRAVVPAAFAILGGCEEPQVAKRETLPPPPPVTKGQTYPLDRKLTDQAGRSFEATIWGKVGQEIYVFRNSDGMEAIVPISKLSPEDLVYAAALPVQAPPAGFSPDSARSPETPPAALPDRGGTRSNFVASREKDIARLTEECETLATDMAATTNQMLIRNYQSKIERNVEEIRRLQTAIDNHRPDSR